MPSSHEKIRMVGILTLYDDTVSVVGDRGWLSRGRGGK